LKNGTNNAEEILLSCMEYLNVDSLIMNKDHYVSACKRVAIVIIKDTITNISHSGIGRLVAAERSIVGYAVRNYAHLYHGESKVYHFIYLNIRAKVEGRCYFTINDFFRRSVLGFPENESLNFYKAKPLAMYLVRQYISNSEINHMLGFPELTKASEFKLEKKDLYLSIIDSTMDEMIEVLNKQQIK